MRGTRRRSPRKIATIRGGRAFKALVIGLVSLFLSGSISALLPTVAYAAGTLLFNQPFHNNTPDGLGSVALPLPPVSATGGNQACLTASGNSNTGVLRSCTSSNDAQGAGKLRLTANATSLQGGVFGATSVPTSQGLDVTFNSYQYGGSSADGIAFVLAAVDPAAPTAPARMGQLGGGLGYSAWLSAGLSGLSTAYMGIGLDVFGNFSNTTYQGSGCTNPAYISTTGAQVKGQVVVRGPGAGTVGYCAVNSTATTTSSPVVPLHAVTRAASVVPVEVVVNPTAQTIVTDSGVSATPGTYKVVFTPVGGTSRTLTGSLPTVPAGLYPSSSWTTSAGIPRQLAFGWVGSTGGSTDFHEIDNTRVVTFNPVPQLNVAATSFTQTTLAPGDPVTYSVTAGVSAGADESLPIAVTQTMPAGVVPVGAFGSGWVCQAPSGQTITCTNSNGPFTNGTSLTPITVVAIVTGASVTPAFVRSATTTTASATDANPGFAATATAGTIAATPTGIAISPTSGTISGGGAATVTGTNITGATAIEIGTTAQQQAGTPVVLLPCQSGPAAGCFTVNANGSLAISSMPARASAASVGVTVVTVGVAGVTSYVYTSAPATPVAPTATAGITSATVTWVAPASNGSTITGYVVTPIRNGVAQTPVSFDASTTTRTLTGLTAAASYTFTVAAVNAVGTGAASPASAAVVPYALPAAPTITAVSAGSTSANLSWTAPASNGSAITGYVVTPYIGGVAQTAQTFASTATTQSITGLTGGTTYTFRVAAINAAGTGPQSAASSAVTINASPSLALPPPPLGEVGAAYTDQFTVSGGTAPYAWSISSGSLPPGLILNAATGLLSGTPTTAGSFPFTVRVADASGQAATQSLTISIASAPTLPFPPPPAGEVGVTYSSQLTVSGGTSPFVWSVSAGALPAGVTLNSSTGLLSGTPTAAGTASFTVRVVDAFSQAVTKTVSLVIAPLPTLAFPAPPAGQVGVGYSDTLVVTGGTAPFVWSVSAGSLPPGLTLNASTGVLAGTPTTAGSTPFTVQVSDAFGVTATQAVTFTVGVGPIVIVKSSDATSAAPGGVVTYAVTATNTGAAAFSGVTFTDALAGVLDDAVYNADATATTGAVTFTSPNLTWTGNLAAGAAVTVTYSVTVNDPDTGNKILSNEVTSSTVGTTCPVGGTDPRCSTTVTVSVLTITSASTVTTTEPGQVVGFTYTAVNDGQTTFPNATFTVPLGNLLDDATYNLDGATTTGTIENVGGDLVWAGSLAPGASVVVTSSLTVNNPDTGNKVLAATISSATQGSTCPVGNALPACTSTVPVLTPGLSITNTADVSTMTPGGTITYTVSLANTGETAYTGTTVTSSLAGVLSDATYNADATASTGTVAYSAPNLTWTGSLAAGASATITYTVTVLDPDPGDKLLINAVTSPAIGSNCPVGGSDPACTAVVQVLVPDLTITKTASSATTTPGGVVTYTVTVSNTGPTPYTGATFADSLTGLLDDATYNADVTASAGTASYSAPTLSWTGNLTPGASATIVYSVTTGNPVTGDAILTNTIASSTLGNNCPTGGTDSRCTTSVPVSQLILAQSYDVAAATPGQSIRLTATFTNTGSTPYTGITVTSSTAGTVDDAIPTGDQTASSGTLELGAGGITWFGDIPVGGVVTVTGTLTVRNPDTGNKIITGVLVSAASGNNCPSGGSDPRCTATVNVVVPDLTITTSANAGAVQPGDTVDYTVTVTNSGQTPYTGVTVANALAGLLDDAVYNGDVSASSGAATYTAPTISWTGDVAVGAVVTITFSATVLNPDPGDKIIASTVSSDAVGSNCLPASGNPACSSTVAVLTPALTIIRTASSSTAVPGQTITYTVTVANTGQTVYPAATISTSLVSVLDDAVYNNDATASTGTVSFSTPTLTWTGSLNPTAVATITYSVTVKNPDPGDQSLTSTAVSTTPGSNCPSGGSDPRCTVVVMIVPSALLTFTKTSAAPSVAAGGTVLYTITVANAGATPYLGATFTDNLTDVLTDATYNANAAASAGVVSYAAPVLSWTGDVPASGAVTITYSVGVTGPGTGNDILVDSVVSPSLGGNCPAASTDPRCTATVTVSALTITQTANVTSTTPGGIVTFTATLVNTGQTPYVGITLEGIGDDVVDDAVAYGGQTASSGTFALSGNGLVWNGSIPVGGTVTITGSAQVNDPDTGDKVLKTVSVSNAPGSNCPTGSTDPACFVSVPVLTPGLTMTTSANVTVTVPGGVVAYTVTITNSGETPYTAATVTNDLGGALDDAVYNGNVTASAGTATFAAQTITWSGDLGVNDVVTVTFSMTVRNPDPGDKILVNVLASTDVGSSCLPASGSAGCTHNVVVLSPALTIAKSASAATTVPGGTVTFTIAVTNSGQVPYSGAVVSDALTGVLDDATYNNDAAATVGTVGFASPTLTWTGNLNPGSSATITYSVTVLNPDTGDAELANSVSSTVAGNNCATGSTDSRCSASVLVAELTMMAATNVSTAIPGEIIFFTATITNSGRTSYTNAVVNAGLTGGTDDATYNGDATVTSGAIHLDIPNGQLVWTGDLAPGQSATITASLTVNNPDLGDKAMTASVSSDVAGSNCPLGNSNPSCSASVLILTPGLGIVKTADATTTTPGGTVTYTITVTNDGESAYQGASVSDNLTGLLADAVYNADASATSGTVTYAAPTVTWTGDLAIGASVTISYSVTVNNPDLGDRVLINTVTSPAIGSTCPTAGSGGAGCRVVVPVLIPALTITKAAATGTGNATVVAGSAISYTVTVANTGQTPYAGASFTDDLADVLDDAAYNGDAAASTGTVAFTSPDLTWTGNLAPGATATITYSVTTALPANGDHVAINAVASTTAGSTCLTGSADAACTTTTAVLVPALTIIKTADQTAAVVGSTVQYTITATNNGQAAYTGATITDSLASVVNNAMYNADATATNGTVAYTAPTLTWTGNLAVGAGVTITYSVTVDDAATAGADLVNRVASTAAGSTCTGTGTEPACTIATAITAQSLALTDLTPAFTLTGEPNSSVVQNGAVTMTVTTNSTDGYTVAVQATSPTLTGQTAGNGDSIPVSSLLVRESGTSAFQPLSDTAAVPVRSQGQPSAPGGDAVSNDYAIDVPFVASDTYSTTLDYIAASQ
ncbi:putative Ig domain-containing protein [Frankia sp. AiPs1]|nr:putative Ig domain-containing protein [Frankia sp. AiPs1]MCM3921831.1 putative Ig domain-containing protein [Frankia sp. AiPs1]